jgi:hypothetical protein
MAFEEGKDLLTCSACGAVHEARWSRMPVCEPMKVTCRACKAVIFDCRRTWKDYCDVSLQR